MTKWFGAPQADTTVTKQQGRETLDGVVELFISDLWAALTLRPPRSNLQPTGELSCG